MSEDRRKLGWPWIAAVLIGLPVLYIASFGPACWITSRLNTGHGMIPVVYAPVVKCLSSRKKWLRQAVGRFSMFGAAPGWRWRPADPIPRAKVAMPEHWNWTNRTTYTPEEARQVREHFERLRNK